MPTDTRAGSPCGRLTRWEGVVLLLWIEVEEWVGRRDGRVMVGFEERAGFAASARVPLFINNQHQQNRIFTSFLIVTFLILLPSN